MDTNFSQLNKYYKKCKKYRILSKHNDAILQFDLFCKLFNNIYPTFSYISIDSIEYIYNISYIDSIPYQIKELFFFILIEVSICFWYTKYKYLGNIISDRLVFQKINNHKSMIFKNQRFYIQPITFLHSFNLIPKLDPLFSPLNPSIIPINDGYLVNIRAVNYSLDEQSRYTIHFYPQQSQNYILKLDNNFNIISQCKLIDKSLQSKNTKSYIKGFEDLQLFKINNELWAACTSLEYSIDSTPQIVLLKIITNNNYSTCEINRVIVLNKINNSQCEKNWLPFYNKNFVLNSQDDIKFIYGYNPFRIQNIWGDLNLCHDFINTDINLLYYTQLDLSKFRGSAGPLTFNEGFLVVIHEVTDPTLNSIKRDYTHRFLYFNSKFELKKMSLPWIYKILHIEYCRSICWSNTNKDSIIMGVGIQDKFSFLYTISATYIDSILFNLDFFIL